MELKPIPVVGQSYKFYDDGQIEWDHRFEATVTRVIDREEAHSVILTEPIAATLIDTWEYMFLNQNSYMPIYDENTEAFVECEIPGYSSRRVWFVRGTDGGWVALPINSYWEIGDLDVDGEMSAALEGYE